MTGVLYVGAEVEFHDLVYQVTRVNDNSAFAPAAHVDDAHSESVEP